MKLTGAQITRLDEVFELAKYFSNEEPCEEPQRHRIEMLIDDIFKIVGLPEGGQQLAETPNHR